MEGTQRNIRSFDARRSAEGTPHPRVRAAFELVEADANRLQSSRLVASDGRARMELKEAG